VGEGTPLFCYISLSLSLVFLFFFFGRRGGDVSGTELGWEEEGWIWDLGIV
jgi:hypothetical protein